MRDCCEPGRQFKFEFKIAAWHRLSRAVFYKNNDLRKCWYMDYMQQSGATTTYHVNPIAVQQVVLQHVACQSRASHAACRLPCKRTFGGVLQHSPDSCFPMNIHATILYNEFGNHTFRVTATSPWGQWESRASRLCLCERKVPNYFATRRSENDSTLGRPRLENANISWVWPFHTVITFMVNGIVPPNFRP